MENFNPAPGQVLVRPTDEKNQLILTKKQNPNICIVKAVGKEYIENKNFIYPPCKKNDKILHTTIGYETFYLNGKEHRVISFKNILGVYGKNTD
jgi:co-chaperonin GroES (HSP10)